MNAIGGGCSAAIGSLTLAIKAQRALAAAAIPTKVIKYEEGARGRGCIYGLSFSCPQRVNIETVLTRERIRVTQWNTRS